MLQWEWHPPQPLTSFHSYLNKHFNCFASWESLSPSQGGESLVSIPQHLVTKIIKTKSHHTFHFDHQFKVDLSSEFFILSSYMESNTLLKNSSFFCINMALRYITRAGCHWCQFRKQALGVLLLPRSWLPQELLHFIEMMITFTAIYGMWLWMCFLPAWAYFSINSNLPL